MGRTHQAISSAPILTVGFVLLSILSFSWPGLTEFLRFDRQAVQGGEVWRILSAPLTHLSLSHLCWNLAAFLVFGATLEKITKSGLILVCGLTAVVSGIVCLCCHSELMYYGGASGLISGIVAYLGLLKWVEKDANRIFWLAILFLLILKIIFEVVARDPLFVIIDMNGVRLLSSSHVSGVVVAAGLFFLWQRKNSAT